MAPTQTRTKVAHPDIRAWVGATMRKRGKTSKKRNFDFGRDCNTFAGLIFYNKIHNYMDGSVYVPPGESMPDNLQEEFRSILERQIVSDGKLVQLPARQQKQLGKGKGKDNLDGDGTSKAKSRRVTKARKAEKSTPLRTPRARSLRSRGEPDSGQATSTASPIQAQITVADDESDAEGDEANSIWDVPNTPGRQSTGSRQTSGRDTRGDLQVGCAFRAHDNDAIRIYNGPGDEANGDDDDDDDDDDDGTDSGGDDDECQDDDDGDGDGASIVDQGRGVNRNAVNVQNVDDHSDNGGDNHHRLHRQRRHHRRRNGRADRSRRNGGVANHHSNGDSDSDSDRPRHHSHTAAPSPLPSPLPSSSFVREEEDADGDVFQHVNAPVAPMDVQMHDSIFFPQSGDPTSSALDFSTMVLDDIWMNPDGTHFPDMASFDVGDFDLDLDLDMDIAGQFDNGLPTASTEANAPAATWLGTLPTSHEAADTQVESNNNSGGLSVTETHVAQMLSPPAPLPQQQQQEHPATTSPGAHGRTPEVSPMTDHNDTQHVSNGASTSAASSDVQTRPEQSSSPPKTTQDKEQPCRQVALNHMFTLLAETFREMSRQREMAKSGTFQDVDWQMGGSEQAAMAPMMSAF